MPQFEGLRSCEASQMTLKYRTGTIAAAKLVLEKMGFSERSILSSIIQAQKQLRQMVAEAAAWSKITDFSKLNTTFVYAYP